MSNADGKRNKAIAIDGQVVGRELKFGTINDKTVAIIQNNIERLQIDDNGDVNITGDLTIGGAPISIGGNVIINNGNSFNTDMLIGTNDPYDLILERNGIPEVVISESLMTINESMTIYGDVLVEGTITANNNPVPTPPPVPTSIVIDFKDPITFSVPTLTDNSSISINQSRTEIWCGINDNAVQRYKLDETTGIWATLGVPLLGFTDGGVGMSFIGDTYIITADVDRFIIYKYINNVPVNVNYNLYYGIRFSTRQTHVHASNNNPSNIPFFFTANDIVNVCRDITATSPVFTTHVLPSGNELYTENKISCSSNASFACYAVFETSNPSNRLVVVTQKVSKTVDPNPWFNGNNTYTVPITDSEIVKSFGYATLITNDGHLFVSQPFFVQVDGTRGRVFCFKFDQTTKLFSNHATINNSVSLDCADFGLELQYDNESNDLMIFSGIGPTPSVENEKIFIVNTTTGNWKDFYFIQSYLAPNPTTRVNNLESLGWISDFRNGTLLVASMNTLEFTLWHKSTDNQITHTSNFNLQSTSNQDYLNIDEDTHEIIVNNSNTTAFVIKDYADGALMNIDTTTNLTRFDTDMKITGDLEITGTTTTINTVDLEVKDNTILLNAGEIGAGVSAGDAGFIVDRGTETDFSLKFDEADDTLKSGISTLLALAHREDIPIDDGIAIWDASTKMFETTNTLSDKDLSLPSILDLTEDHKYNIIPSELIANRDITLPLLTADDEIVFKAHTQTLTNKTLTLPVISAISNVGLLTLPTAVDTLIGRGTTDSLTNKTLLLPKISSIVNTGTLTLPTATDTLVGRDTTDTLTNKTLTTPIISTISNTGLLTLPTATDTLVGRDTTDTLTNKTLTTPIISTISNTGTLTLPTATDTLVGRDTTDTLSNKTLLTPDVINNMNLHFSYIQFDDIAAPINPSNGQGRLYKKSGNDGLFWKPESAGAEVDLTVSPISSTAFNDLTFEIYDGTTSTSKKLLFEVAGSISTSTTIKCIQSTDVEITLPTSTDTLVGLSTSSTLFNKTMESVVLNTAISGSAFLNENDMVSDSGNKVASQRSIKAYVDNNTKLQEIYESSPGGQITTNTNANSVDFKYGGNSNRIFRCIDSSDKPRFEVADTGKLLIDTKETTAIHATNTNSATSGTYILCEDQGSSVYNRASFMAKIGRGGNADMFSWTTYGNGNANYTGHTFELERRIDDADDPNGIKIITISTPVSTGSEQINLLKNVECSSDLSMAGGSGSLFLSDANSTGMNHFSQNSKSITLTLGTSGSQYQQTKTLRFQRLQNVVTMSFASFTLNYSTGATSVINANVPVDTEYRPLQTVSGSISSTIGANRAHAVWFLDPAGQFTIIRTSGTFPTATNIVFTPCAMTYMIQSN